MITVLLESGQVLDYRKQLHEEIISQLSLALDKSDEKFIEHYKSKYDGVFPIWVAIEVSSFGLLSKLFSNLKNKDKADIADTYYNVPHKYIRSWLYAISTFRNRCAHYGRVFDRKLTIKPMLYKKDSAQGIFNDSPFSVYFILSKIIKEKQEWGSFLDALDDLFTDYVKIDISKIGFPKNWYNLLAH